MKTTGFQAFHTVFDDGKTELLTIRLNGVIDFYISTGENVPYRYMFGLPAENHTILEAIDIAINFVPEYLKYLPEEMA